MISQSTSILINDKSVDMNDFYLLATEQNGAVDDRFIDSLKERSVITLVQEETDDIPNFYDERLDFLLEKRDDLKIQCCVKKRDSTEFWFNYKKIRIGLKMADSMKNMSKCSRLHVCCVIMKDGRVLSTGINGSPKGMPNCCDVFTLKDRLKPEYYTKHHEFSSMYEVHAEMNAIIALGKNTSIDSYDKLSMFCTTCPCPDCAKNIVQAGIKDIYFHSAYDRQPEGGLNLKNYFKVNVIQC